MKSKITLKELVGTKIIYAVLLVCYYWMWARRDWHSCYEVIQDELAIQNLRRTDAIGLKLMVAAMVVIAFACAVGAVDGPAAGYGLVGAVLVWSVIRFILFCIMDSKGI